MTSDQFRARLRGCWKQESAPGSYWARFYFITFPRWALLRTRRLSAVAVVYDIRESRISRYGARGRPLPGTLRTPQRGVPTRAKKMALAHFGGVTPALRQSSMKRGSE